MIPTAGGPGSGKGSQCGRVAEVSGYQHLSTGDLLRQEVMAGTERWVRLFEVISSGQLAPDVSMNMVSVLSTVRSTTYLQRKDSGCFSMPESI